MRESLRLCAAGPSAERESDEHTGRPVEVPPREESARVDPAAPVGTGNGLDHADATRIDGETATVRLQHRLDARPRSRIRPGKHPLQTPGVGGDGIHTDSAPVAIGGDDRPPRRVRNRHRGIRSDDVHPAVRAAAARAPRHEGRRGVHLLEQRPRDRAALDAFRDAAPPQAHLGGERHTCGSCVSIATMPDPGWATGMWATENPAGSSADELPR